MVVRAGWNGGILGEGVDGTEMVNVVESLEGWEKWLRSVWYRGIVVFLM